jgi:hypothetical protein
MGKCLLCAQLIHRRSRCFNSKKIITCLVVIPLFRLLRNILISRGNHGVIFEIKVHFESVSFNCNIFVCSNTKHLYLLMISRSITSIFSGLDWPKMDIYDTLWWCTFWWYPDLAFQYSSDLWSVMAENRTSDSQPGDCGFESRRRHGVVSVSRIP